MSFVAVIDLSILLLAVFGSNMIVNNVAVVPVYALWYTACVASHHVAIELLTNKLRFNYKA